MKKRSYISRRRESSRGGLVVERWSDNRLDSITVDRIPLKYGVLIVQRYKYLVAIQIAGRRAV